MILLSAAGAVYLGGGPLIWAVRRQESEFQRILQAQLLLDIPPRLATLVSGAALVMMGSFGYLITSSLVGVAVGAAAGAILPTVMLRVLRRRRLAKLEYQLVGGIQTLSSGVRAGLNLVQSIQLLAREGPIPLRQEFAHLMREYDYGMPLEEAMANSSKRIGSGDFKLLFAALQTHRERGGDLGETLNRIAESIREIQRLEKRIETLTAQGRATARWLSAMPAVVLGILYIIDPPGTLRVFEAEVGRLILLGIMVLNVLGFIWIKKIVSVDI